MVGSHFVKVSRATIAAAGRTDPRESRLQVERFEKVDVTRPSAVDVLIRSSPEPVVVNFAARTDVDGIERERGTGSTATGPAWIVNAEAPKALASSCHSTGKYFVQLSTDFVFDGRNGPYDEQAARSPLSEDVSWYGWTKSEGERLSVLVDPGAAVVRISYPYRSDFSSKLDFARWMIERYRSGTLPPLYANQQVTPTWVPDVSRTLEVLVSRRPSGVFHVASPDITTPYEFGRELLTLVDGSVPRLETGTLLPPKPGSGIAPRPIRGGLRSRRLVDLGIELTPWSIGIRKLLAESQDGP